MNVLRKAMADEVLALKPVLDTAYRAILSFQQQRTQARATALREALAPAIAQLMTFRPLLPTYKQREFTALEQRWSDLAPGDLIMLFDHCVSIMHVRLERQRSVIEAQQPWSASLLGILDVYRAAPEVMPVEGDFLCSGIAASPGRVTGQASVVRDMSALPALRDGVILVCRFTTPDLVLHLRRIRALVTDEGGALSHAAIIARELGVPAVTGCRNATAVISEGQTIHLDGDLGLVMSAT